VPASIRETEPLFEFETQTSLPCTAIQEAPTPPERTRVNV
jgi:hypothetical protein